MPSQGGAGEFEDKVENGIRVGGGLVGPAGHVSSLINVALYNEISGQIKVGLGAAFICCAGLLRNN